MKSGRLVNFPVSFFSVVMGLAGTAIALGKAESVLGTNLKISWFILGLSLPSFFLASGRCLLSEGMKSVSKNKIEGNNAGLD